MSLLVLSKEHKKNLQFVGSVDADVAIEFARISIEFVLKGANQKVYTAAAKKLGNDSKLVQAGVEGLMYLFTEASKRALSEMDFNDSVMMLGFSEELHQKLMQLFMENKDEIRRISGQLGMTLQSYKDVQWRIDAQIASRTLRQHTEPTLTMKFDTSDVNSNDVSILLQTDPKTLNRITQQLDAALKAVKSSHYRRVTRSIK